VGCTGTRLKTAKIQETHLQVPEESLNRGNCDVIQVQQLDNYESYFEFESGSPNINLKNRLKTSLYIFAFVFVFVFVSALRHYITLL
jgi:hypothetical protein